MNKSGYVLILFSGITLLLSCNSIDPAIQVPSYIHIDKISLNTNYATEGSNSAKITDAWVYVNDQHIGTFQIPATIPVLAQGNSKITIGAGIKMNGISATRADYDFYTQYTQTSTLKPGEKLNLNPVVNYLPNTDFEWKEDFETVGVSLSPGPYGSDDTIKRITGPDVFEGNSSGAVYLDGDTFEAISSSAFKLASNGDPVYLEFNYKSNNPFVIGFYNSDPTYIPALTVNPSAQWNKIYINLGPLLQAYPSQDSLYTISFGMGKDPSVTQAQLFLDNIKLIHYK